MAKSSGPHGAPRRRLPRASQGIVIGAGLGIVFGGAWGNPGVGLVLGAAAGLVIGGVLLHPGRKIEP